MHCHHWSPRSATRGATTMGSPRATAREGLHTAARPVQPAVGGLRQGTGGEGEDVLGKGQCFPLVVGTGQPLYNESLFICFIHLYVYPSYTSKHRYISLFQECGQILTSSYLPQMTRQSQSDIWKNKCEPYKPTENCHISAHVHNYLQKQFLPLP